MSNTIESRPKIGRRMLDELKRLLQIFLYMLVCVAAVL